MTQAAQRTQTRPPFPQVGEVFELTTSEEITGLGLVADFGYTPSKWRTSAATIPAGTKRKFKLVQVVYQPDLAAVARACEAQGGKETNGCWMKVFDETFGHNGVNPVGVPDASWGNPHGHFPMVYSNGYRTFRWADHKRFERWRWLWLVAV